jgi:arylsulfatase A-like enzyme
MLAMLAALDDSVGRVVAAWKAAGLYDNSVIVFQSDK